MVDPKRVPYAGFDASWVPDALMQGDPQGSEWRPGEADVSIRPGWFWRASEDDKVRAPANLMELYFKSVGRNSKLLLNVPPTSDGLLHENDVRALDEFAEARRHLFARNLLEGTQVHASGGSAPSAVLDASGDRYWQAPAGERSGWIEFESPAPITFDVLRLEESIEHGQHIANHRVDAWQDGGWQTVCWGTTIGNARLARFAPCTASRIRVSVEFAYDTPRLRRVALYRTSQEP
jgi:alpha-L-fucosidase